MIKSNFNLKLLAFFIALIIWFQLTLLQEHVTTIDIPIRVVNVPDFLYLYKQDSLKVPFRIKGKGIHIVLFHLSGHTIDYNGIRLSLGNNLINMETLEESLPFIPNLEMNVLKSDNIIILTTEKILQKEVPVNLQFDSERIRNTLIQENYSLNDINVTISGPALEINKIDQVLSEKLDNDFLKSRKKTFRIRPVNEHVVIVPQQIELKQVEDLIISRTFSFIPIYHNEDIYSIFPQRVSIQIEGKVDSLNNISSGDINAYIQDNNYKDNDEADVYFKIPPSFRIIDFTPQKVIIKLKNQ